MQTGYFNSMIVKRVLDLAQKFPAHFPLPDRFRNETRPRTQLLEGGVLVNLHGVNTNADTDPEDMISIRLWFCEYLILSARMRERKLLSVEDAKKTIALGNRPKSSGEFKAVTTNHR